MLQSILPLSILRRLRLSLFNIAVTFFICPLLYSLVLPKKTSDIRTQLLCLVRPDRGILNSIEGSASTPKHKRSVFNLEFSTKPYLVYTLVYNPLVDNRPLLYNTPPYLYDL